MRTLFYTRLALDGLRKQKQLTLPYLMTCSLMTAVYYILDFLSRDPIVGEMSGGSALVIVLTLGRFVIVVFSAIFLIYTNSFLIRRRKREFGLYNVLGMDKRNLARILLRESIWSYLFSMVAGLFFGIALSKMAQLFLLRLVKTQVNYAFRIDPRGIGSTAGFYAVIFFFIFLNSLRQLHFANPMELLHSESAGEKPPKARFLLGFVGLLLLLGAYYLAVSIQQPMEALLFFFGAVIMVIISTYLLMICGSVALCRLLQKKTGYYYQLRHFVSVSSMSFRMKRNGAGLASICILLTMVLVMISSSACLYFGKDSAVKARYPADICAEVSLFGCNEEQALIAQELTELCENTEGKDIAPNTLCTFTEYSLCAFLTDKGAVVDMDTVNELSEYERMVLVHLLSVDAYNAVEGTDIHLAPGEVLLLASGVKKSYQPGESFSLSSQSYILSAVGESGESKLNLNMDSSVSATLVLVMENPQEELIKLMEDMGQQLPTFHWYYRFDSQLMEEEQMALARNISDKVEELLFAKNVDFHSACDARIGLWNGFQSTYGGLFFIGILLSLVFLLACVLILYYKQLSEGFEDRSRFAIMQKVGMTKENIRESINSQMRTVFMLPVAFAVLHLCFAFPMVEKVLVLFGVADKPLFLATNAIGVAVVTAFYALVYRITGNAYYNIVSGGKE